ncbi:Gfo/Idh/MocA family protein [Roseateles sp. DB2]|uniref:Gfo/Idh/MocA family protein n=1 Tax=Roseateles sp. DB2 TaxID=3453717 RepID=UPI003EEA904A
MKVLLVGTGSIGRRHLASLRRLRGDLLVDVLREGGRAADQSTEGLGDGVSVVTDLDRALARRPDLMVIANPSALHLRYLLAAVEHRIPFYAEKPVLTTQADVLELKRCIDRARPGTVPSMVGCNLRFLPSLRALRTQIESGELGRVIRASFEAGQWLPDWRPASDYRASYSAKPALGGGVALDLIHEVDAARWLLGDFSMVSGQFWRGSSLEIETEDCACLLMKAASGPVATVQLDYVSRQPFRRYRLVGDQASAEWDLPGRYVAVSTAQGRRELPLGPDAFDVSQTYIAAMSELLSAIQAGTTSSQPIEEGLASLELVLRAKASASLPT